jgi:processive 1,2-diacylglycerol beta-glucosyltransferase
MKKNLLFFYTNPYSGHRLAADAVRTAFRESYNSEIETFSIDAFTHGFPFLAPLIAKTYLKIIKNLPTVWNFLWDNQEVEQTTRPFRELLSALTITKLQDLFNQYQPSALVCTHALPCNILAWGKRKKLFDLPLVAIITDFAVHPYWFDELVDLYIVPTEEIKEAMTSKEIFTSDGKRKYSIKEKKIKVCGIPINPRFSAKKDKCKAKENFHLNPDIPVVLVMGGTNGLGIEKVVSSLYNNLEAQILVVTGMNKKIYQEMKYSFPENGRIRIFEYTRRIPEMMDCADLLITKPGGLTSAEALAKGLPMVIFNPLPGQEERNSDYLVSYGVAKRADKEEQFLKILKYLLNHPPILQRMSSCAQRLSSPEAAVKTARIIYESI